MMRMAILTPKSQLSIQVFKTITQISTKICSLLAYLLYLICTSICNYSFSSFKLKFYFIYLIYFIISFILFYNIIFIYLFGSGCVAGWPVTQPPGLHSRLAGYAAYPSAFGCVAGVLSMCIVLILRKCIFSLTSNRQFIGTNKYNQRLISLCPVQYIKKVSHTFNHRLYITYEHLYIYNTCYYFKIIHTS